MTKAQIVATATFISIISGALVPAYAQTATVSANASTSVRTSKKIDFACVGAAVAKRESALDSAVSTMTSAMNSAYTTRASALASAYTGTEAKTVRASVKVAWTNFSGAMKSARKTYASARHSAWAQFRTDAKACKGGASASDSEGASGEISL